MARERTVIRVKIDFKIDERSARLDACGSVRDMAYAVSAFTNVLYNRLRVYGTEQADCFKSMVRRLISDETPTWEGPLGKNGATIGFDPEELRKEAEFK